MERDPTPDASVERAPLHFEMALSQTLERHPALTAKITQSLETPQLGPYHTEGPTMESHLRLIIRALDDLADGKPHETLARHPDLSKALQAIAVRPDPSNPERFVPNPELVDYAFLHDISKQDCLNLKIEGEKKRVEISWADWQAIRARGKPYLHKGKPVVSISYYHDSEGGAGAHGNKGAAMLADAEVSAYIRTAIAKHEVAYLFSKINAALYEKHFVDSGLTGEEQLFVLVASYIDTVATLTEDGQPNLGNFEHLVQSRENYLLIQSYLDRGAIFRENDLGFLKKQNKVLVKEDIDPYVESFASR